jgi:glutaredoxin 3
MTTGLVQVLMYTRQGCGYCARARALLAQKGVAYTEIDLDQVPGSRQEMQQRSGRNTVPQIFVGERHLGGFDDINALDGRGELDPILASVSRA